LPPQQERILFLIYKNQLQLGVRKLILGRNGDIYSDDPKLRESLKVNLIKELFGSAADPKAYQNEFEAAVEAIPERYLKKFAEMRLDSPFVVAITDEGIKYIRR